MPRKKKLRKFAQPQSYQNHVGLLPGTRYADLAPQARAILKNLARRTKRQLYVRSIYFNKQKVFFSYFWDHLSQKPPGERARRLRYLPAALEVIKKSPHHPYTTESTTKKRFLFHRFLGTTPAGDRFYVQIREDKRTNRKELMSIFPDK